ncbi:hypothetical protein GTP41_10710 [Pseudoduganella sp. DS3]|uniref:UDP-N-acetylmuramate--alanine ligase n=1 Tax=Pseudoduganella guangdongensis TaxID=2692179 RepID=A0A6N9HGJ3_9BURK|nr:hypothetical protein [Pseudoduganella guangdongensis]MYN02570.1 hypothetical protein [Pseudoduganella guangdongensis]
MNTEVKTSIAAAAARMIAQDGADYGSAKRKAARQVLGEAQARDRSDILPDNEQIEEEVRLYHALYNADTHPAHIFRLRTLALQVMEMLEQYQPFLTGSVLSGTAGTHDDIHLQLFADSAKEVQIYLLNKNLHIEISQSPHFRGPRFEDVETVSFMWKNEGVHVELYEQDDLRGAKKKSGDKLLRADIAELRSILNNSSHPSQ